MFKANGIRVRRLFPNRGQPLEQLNKIDPMKAFTLADLEEEQPSFGLGFEPYDFMEELMEDEDLS
mgnify:CR=1 FL=1